jgi:hypothetical protein
LIDAGTSATTFASVPVDDPVEAVEDVDEDAAADDEVELLLLLLLPHPTITAAHSSESDAAHKPLHLRISLLFGRPQFRARISND